MCFYEKTYLHLHENFIKLYEKDIEGQDMEPYKTSFVPSDSIKLDLNNINDPVKYIPS